jgi:hypothetical protein
MRHFLQITTFETHFLLNHITPNKIPSGDMSVQVSYKNTSNNSEQVSRYTTELLA